MQTPPPPATIIRLKLAARLWITGISLAITVLMIWTFWLANMAWRPQPVGLKTWGEFLLAVLLVTIWGSLSCLGTWTYRVVITGSDLHTETVLKLPASLAPFRWLIILAASGLVGYFWLVQASKVLPSIFLYITLSPLLGSQFAWWSSAACQLGQIGRVKKRRRVSSALSLAVPISQAVTSQGTFEPEKFKSLMAIDTTWFEGGAPRLLEALRQHMPGFCFKPDLDGWAAGKGYWCAGLFKTVGIAVSVGVLVFLTYVNWLLPLARGQTAWQTQDVAGGFTVKYGDVSSRAYLDSAGKSVSVGSWFGSSRYRVYQIAPGGNKTWEFRSTDDVDVDEIVLDRQGRPWLVIDDQKTGFLLRWTEDGGERVDYPFSVERFLTVSGQQLWVVGRSQAGGDVELLNLDVDSWQVVHYPFPQQAALGSERSARRLRVVDGTPWLLLDDNPTDVWVWQEGAWQPCGWPQARPTGTVPKILDFVVTADRQLYVLAESRDVTPYVVGRLAEGGWSWTGIELADEGDTDKGHLVYPERLIVDRRGRLWLGSEAPISPFSDRWVAVTAYQYLPGQAARRLVRYTSANSNFVESGFSSLCLGADGYLWLQGSSPLMMGEKLISLDANAASLPNPLPDWAYVRIDLRVQLALLMFFLILVAWLWRAPVTTS